MKKKTYLQKKEEARQEAIMWQNNFNNEIYSYEDLANFNVHFMKIATQYGLIKEFRNNGII